MEYNVYMLCIAGYLPNISFKTCGGFCLNCTAPVLTGQLHPYFAFAFGCVCARAYGCAYVHVCVRACVRIYIMHVCLLYYTIIYAGAVCAYMYVPTGMRTCMRADVRTHVCMRLYVCKGVHVRVCVL